MNQRPQLLFNLDRKVLSKPESQYAFWLEKIILTV